MEENIIQRYVFPNNKETIFRSCDFHLVGEKENRDITSSSIPVTLKELEDNKSDPYLILFYFNKHKPILQEWEKLGEELSGPQLNITLVTPVRPLKKVKFKSVNLDYEKKLYDTFKKLTISNPFHWAKILKDNKYYFVIFYLNTFPVEFYRSIIDEIDIKNRYYKDDAENYYTRYLNYENPFGYKYIEDKKKEKYKVFDSLKLKGKYFTALEDDRPFAGVKKGRVYKIVEKYPGDFFIEEIN